MTKEISDFITAMNVIEVQEKDYVFTFSNAYSGNTYSFQITKLLFDKAYDKRDHFGGEMQVVNIDDIEHQTIDAKGMHS